MLGSLSLQQKNYLSCGYPLQVFFCRFIMVTVYKGWLQGVLVGWEVGGAGVTQSWNGCWKRNVALGATTTTTTTTYYLLPSTS